jgi:hypothetical protein
MWAYWECYGVYMIAEILSVDVGRRVVRVVFGLNGHRWDEADVPFDWLTLESEYPPIERPNGASPPQFEPLR